MKPDHRHELKTNELADWITNFPQWFKENTTFVVGTVAVIVIAAALYMGLFYRRSMASARERSRLTDMLVKLPFQEVEIARGLAQGKDQSYLLVAAARSLENFAQNTRDDQMAALALIKGAESLRAEPRYRLGEVSKEDLAQQVNLAKADYTEALRRASANPSLAANAKYGLGICEEDLGNLEQAERIYRELVGNSAYNGTAAKAAADYRLKTMGDYKGIVVFKPAPRRAVVQTTSAEPLLPTLTSPSTVVDTAKEKPAEPIQPVQVKPAEANLPTATVKQADVNLPAR
jgi:tetratricopeptide (TPR) repeat protein